MLDHQESQIEAEKAASETFNENHEWKVLQQQALTLDSETKEWTSYWPEKYSLKTLLREKEEATAFFALEMQNPTS